MEKLTSIQKLDDVLSIFDPSTNYIGFHRVKINDLLKEGQIDISHRLLTEILYKLVKDNYLRTEVHDAFIGTKTFDDVTFYILTFEGELFQANGGYTKEAKNKIERKKWEDELLIKGEKNGERLNTLTLILGIGTIALVTIELIKFIHDLYGEHRI